MQDQGHHRGHELAETLDDLADDPSSMDLVERRHLWCLDNGALRHRPVRYHER